MLIYAAILVTGAAGFLFFFWPEVNRARRKVKKARRRWSRHRQEREPE